MHIGCVIKQRNWQGQLAGMPVETEVLDARDLECKRKSWRCPPCGFAELSYKTAYESPTGEYTINVYLRERTTNVDALLGSTTVNVKEFLPDRMKIETRLSKDFAKRLGRSEGDEGVHRAARISTARRPPTDASRAGSSSRRAVFPSRNSRITAFTIRSSTRTRSGQDETVDLGEQTTDADGKATSRSQLDRFADATYSMTFFAKPSKAKAAAASRGQASALVSALPYVVGYKADARLEIHQRETAARGRFRRGRSAAKQIAPRERDSSIVIAQELRLGRGEEGEWQLRLRVGLEGAVA